MKISHIFPPLCLYGHTKPYFHNSIKYTLSIYHMMKQVHLNSYTSKPSFSIILNSPSTSSNSILIPPYNTTVSLGWSQMSIQQCLQNIQNVIQPSYRVCSVVRFVQSPFTWINLGVTISVSTFWCSFTPEMPCPYPHR